jgi:hypothetical protein
MKRGKIDTTFTQIYKFSLSWLGIGIEITTGGVDIAIWTETSRLSEVMRSCSECYVLLSVNCICFALFILLLHTFEIKQFFNLKILFLYRFAVTKPTRVEILSVCEGWHFTPIWKTHAWPHHFAQTGGFGPYSYIYPTSCYFNAYAKPGKWEFIYLWKNSIFKLKNCFISNVCNSRIKSAKQIQLTLKRT